MFSKMILTSDEIIWAHNKWNCGYTWLEIGNALNVSDRTVSRAVKKVYGNANKRRVRPKLIYEKSRGKR